METKYLIILPEHDYWDPMREQFNTIENVIVPSKIRGIFSKLHKLHNSIRVNKLICLPLKHLWISKYLNIVKDYPVILVVVEGANCGLHEDWLRNIKKRINIVRSIYYCTNTIPDQNIESYPNIKMLKNNYSDIFCFDKDDANKFELKFYKGIYAKYSDICKYSKNIDFFFVGSNKGRYNELLNIYDELTKKGRRCLFYITGVKKSELKSRNGIITNKKLKYREVIDYVCQSKCIIELIWNKRNNVSFRIWEALIYDCYVLTKNLKVKELVDADNIIPFSDINSIDISFLDNNTDNIQQYELSESITPKHFINCIKNGEI